LEEVSFRAVGYLSVYRALVQPPQAKVVVMAGTDYRVHLDPGPLKIRYQTAANEPRELGVISLDYQTREFPPGSYVVIAVAPQTRQTVTGGGWNAALDRFSEIIALLDLEFPGIAYEKVFEATAAFGGTQLFIDPEQGLPIGLDHKYRDTDIATQLPSRVNDLTNLPVGDRDRFVLASRWLRRANDATNSIDRVLFYYMVLEVFPTIKGSDVPRAVATLLAERVYSGISDGDIKDRLKLGPICGFRAEIIHEGKAGVATMEELNVVNDYVERLQAIARTCLRLLAGLAPGSELDRWVLPRVST
jgi:hypothetical protein